MTKPRAEANLFANSRIGQGETTISTIKEIAEAAGVSIGTVDRVLHDRGRVSRDTADKVRRVIAERDYKPNVFARNLKMSRDTSFGIFMPDPAQDSRYWSQPVRGIERAMERLDGLRVTAHHFFYDKYSRTSFERAGKKLLDTRLDGLLIVPALSGAVEAFLKRIPGDLPYVFFDSMIPETRYVSFIGENSFQSGVLSGKLMDLLIKDGGRVAVIKVLPEDYHINDRVDGFLSFCDRCPHIRPRAYEVDPFGRRENRERIFSRMLEENPGLKGVFVTNASTHQLADYLKNRGMSHDIRIIGYDLIEENVRLLRDGTIDFLISQQSERQGFEGIMALYRHVILNQTVPRKILMQLDIVTSENVDYYQS